ncbi:MAG: ABC transporter substrate-binding protein [Armatimonadota bacterium]|nr:ABC transporter substrate-binding protein [Armatimonadota bacterium]MDR7486969.1 ABC transporter substrate-binding protein [Armatimonadota bacterium]MDR7532996.1 ABC transporter substrate-binding protein [Armatimonadota bacterium]MDR7537598.1 ABC transporter substrate-binding protein [Armatimonadota bacterium]
MATVTRRRFLQGAVSTLAAGAVVPALRIGVAWGQQTVPFKLGPVVLGDLAIMAPVLVGVERGFFREEGIAPEVVTFTGGPPLLRGVLAGTADLGLTGATDPLVFRAQGAPIRAVAVITEKNHFTLIGAPGIGRVADLRGKSIGVTAVGATTWVFARLLAKQQGWDPVRDVRIVGLGGLDAQMAALRRGEVQAFIFGDAGALAEHLGVGKIILRLDEVTPKWISEVAYATSDVIRKRKEDLRKVLRGYFRAQRFCRDNADETIRIAARGIGWPEPATRRAYENTRPLWSIDGRFDVDAMKFMQDTLLELGVLTVRWPLSDHYTAEFVPVRL